MSCFTSFADSSACESGVKAAHAGQQNVEASLSQSLKASTSCELRIPAGPLCKSGAEAEHQ